MLNKKQFHCLNSVYMGKCDRLDESTYSEMAEKGYVENQKLTEKGLNALEPYKVKRAVFIAAGFGSRMVPITLTTPKPLVKVNGVRLIETILDAVLAAGIEEIYIVRGYLGEQFDCLLDKYPMIKFIENPKYNEANNISSVVKAKDLLKNTYVCEADLYLYNPELITTYQYESNYLGFKTAKTDDWCFIQNPDGTIAKVSVGGENCHQMVGISYWTEADGEKLGKDAVELFESEGGKNKYWDEVPLTYYKDNYSVQIRECEKQDIIEIDTFDELVALDPTYKDFKA